MIHISGHNCQAVNQGSGGDESVTIGARTGNVERGATLRNGPINSKDATFERGQDMAIHPATKNRSLFVIAPFDEENSYFQFQDGDRR